MQAFQLSTNNTANDVTEINKNNNLIFKNIK